MLRRIALLSLSCGLLTACPANVAEDARTSVPFQPNALDVSYQVDTSRAVSAKVLAEEGGELEVEDARGTRYELHVPPDALLRDVEIRLTAISAVDGLPLSGGAVGAVRLEPEGLRFLAPVILTIFTQTDLDVSNVSGFGSGRDGQDFHLVRAEVEPRAVTLELWHFSAAGAAVGTAAERAAQQQRVPRSYEAYAQQRAAEMFHRARQRDELTFTADELAEYDELLVGWYDAVVKPALDGAGGSCDSAPEAVAVYFAWLQQIYLLGGEAGPGIPEREGAGMALVQQLANDCIESYYAQCRDQHDLAQAENLLMAVRLSALAGIGDGARAEQYQEKCTTFELEFDSRMELIDFSIGHGRGTVRFVAPVMSTGVEPVPVTAPLQIADLSMVESFKLPECSYAFVNGPAVSRGLSLAANPWEGSIPKDERGAIVGKAIVTAIPLHLAPGMMAGIYRELCPEDPATDLDLGVQYFAGWVTMHMDEAVSEGPLAGHFAITFSGADILGGELFAQKTWNRTDSYAEATTLKLWHRPQ